MKTIVIASLMLLPLVGCVNPPIQPRLDPYGRQQVYLDSDRLKKDTAAGTPTVARDEVSQNLMVTVPIRSTINKTLYVDYTVTFFDASGQVLETMGPITKQLDPNTPDQIRVNSTTRRAADFQVNFRYAR